MKTYKIYFLVAILVAIGFMGVATKKVFGNPSSIGFYRSAVASTTLNYLTFGTATATPVLDTQADIQNLGTSVSAPADMANLEIIWTASSTQSELKIAFEYASDVATTSTNFPVNCQLTPANCDWFSDTVSGVFASGATTTIPVNLNTSNSYDWSFASSSSTVGGVAGGAKDNIASRIITVPVPTRYVRAVISVPGTAQPGAFWTNWVYKRQNR